jgi:urease accessory protein UreF
LSVTHQESQDISQPILIESMTLDNTKFAAGSCPLAPAAISMGKIYDSYATLLLHGPNSLNVARRATMLSEHIASLKTRVRKGDFGDDESLIDESDLLQLPDSLGGKVLMSINPIESDEIDNLSEPQTHLVRILAESNEDIYRILHFCLKPCSQFLGGLEPYKDRIHSSGTVRSHSTTVGGSVRNTSTPAVTRISEKELYNIANDLVFGRDAMIRSEGTGATDLWFHACLFSDSSLPVGSFAHSLGTEAASQLGLFSMLNNTQSKNGNTSCSEDDLADYVYAVSRSNARFSTPIILGGYSISAHVLPLHGIDRALHSWSEIDSYTDKLLKSNGPGCRASMDQGLGFLRIAPSLLRNIDDDETTNFLESIRASINYKSLDKSHSSIFAKGHAAPMFGVLAGSLGMSPLDACRVFAFGAARDSVSAAVRLNLIGPVAGLSLLNDVGRGAVEEGLEEGLLSMSACTAQSDSVTERYRHWLRSASTCAPVMDVIQPCHDMLAVRLFRT